MPTDTFFRLPEDKRKKIIQAAISEFSTVTFDKASINQIIKEAGISRGSFYMYFEDLYDLGLYLMEQTKQEVMDEMRRRYTNGSNQLDGLMMLYHDVVYDYYNQDTYRNLFKNIITYFQGRPEAEMEALKGKLPVCERYDQLIRILDPVQFRNQNEDFINETIDLALVIFRNVMFKTFMLNLDKATSNQLLRQNIQILKHGYGGNNNA
ncbi:MAG: TetR/AcrR family transcriptional regulator [Bacilli bacterium]|nr:TetR/AcrR family transcriptional regulator [Bacilli bacterium]MBN2876346.1 TetR/AcrR family transcriptional regulator [Bacilli bacterium]